MRIYVTHSKDFDYKDKLYEPIEKSGLAAEHEFVLLYKNGEPQYSSKEKIRDCNLLIAEATKHSTGSGVEIGWANAFNKPVVVISEYGARISRSLQFVTKDIKTYKNAEELLSHIGEAIKQYS